MPGNYCNPVFQSKGAVDRDFRDHAQAVFEKALDQLAATGALMDSSDCRSRFCRLDIRTPNRQAMDDFIGQFPALPGWNSDMRMLITDQPGGVVATVFVTRDGVSMPRLASE